MYYSVVANRRQPNLYTRYIVGGGGACGYLIEVLFPVSKHNSTPPLHNYNDGPPQKIEVLSRCLSMSRRPT